MLKGRRPARMRREVQTDKGSIAISEGIAAQAYAPGSILPIACMRWRSFTLDLDAYSYCTFGSGGGSFMRFALRMINPNKGQL